MSRKGPVAVFATVGTVAVCTHQQVIRFSTDKYKNEKCGRTLTDGPGYGRGGCDSTLPSETASRARHPS
jgi:hypothetical protein